MSVKNSSSALVFLEDVVEVSDDLLVSRWFLCSYLSFLVFGGFLSNSVLACHLIRSRTLPAVLHLCFADIASLVLLAPYEISVLSGASGVWVFPSACCQLFLGLEVLLGTLVVYLIIVIDFSSATGGSKSSLSIPLLTVWLLAGSLSVPHFVFGGVVSPRPQFTVCCVPKGTAFLIGGFRLVVPVFLLFVGSAVVIFALFRLRTPEEISCSRLALSLSLTYIAVSVQRSVLSVLYGLLLPPLTGPDAFKTPPLADVTDHPAGTLSLALVHYTLSALRPVIAWTFATKNTKVQSQLNQPQEEISAPELQQVV